MTTNAIIPRGASGKNHLQTGGIMEAAGIEPASAVAPDRASTSVVRASSHPPGRFANDLPTGQPSFSVALRAIGSPSAPSPIVGADYRISGRIRVDVAYLASTRRRVRVRSCSHLLWCRLIYEANRRPRLALYRRTDHVET